MFQYLAMVCALCGALIGILGHTSGTNRRLTRRGWIAVVVALFGFLFGAGLQIEQDLAESEAALQMRELQGVALIELHQALNRHVYYYRGLLDDGFDPSYFGDTIFELPGFLGGELWNETLDAHIPDFSHARDAYVDLRNSTMEVMLFYGDVMKPKVLTETSSFRRQPLASYFVNWSPKNQLSDFSWSELETHFNTNTTARIQDYSQLLRAAFSELDLPDNFEDEHREQGHVKDDLN